MVLAKEETVVKEWEYATSKGKVGKTSHTLTVTNKRIVAQSKSPRKTVREEIPVSAIKSLSVTHEMASLFWAIVFIVVGVIVFFVSFGAGKELGELAWLVTILYIIIAAFFIYIGVIRLKQGKFSLTITYQKGGDFISVGAMRMFKSPTLFKGLFGKKLKVSVNNQAADEILETIGALVF